MDVVSNTVIAVKHLAEVAPPIAARRVVREVVAGRVEGARGLAVVGARQVIDEPRRETSAARRVEAGPRRRRYEGEEYEWPHPGHRVIQGKYLQGRPGSDEM